MQEFSIDSFVLGGLVVVGAIALFQLIRGARPAPHHLAERKSLPHYLVAEILPRLSQQADNPVASDILKHIKFSVRGHEHVMACWFLARALKQATAISGQRCS